MSILRVFAALAVLLTCAIVRAQVVPELAPPVAQSSTDVPYPNGAEGDAAVELELILEIEQFVSDFHRLDVRYDHAIHAEIEPLSH